MTNGDPFMYLNFANTNEDTGIATVLTTNVNGNSWQTFTASNTPDIRASENISSSSVRIGEGQANTWVSDHTTIPNNITQWGGSNIVINPVYPMGQPYVQPLVPYNPYQPLVPYNPFVQQPQQTQQNELKPEDIMLFLEGLNIIPEKELEKIREALKPKKEIEAKNRFDDLIL